MRGDSSGTPAELQSAVAMVCLILAAGLTGCIGAEQAPGSPNQGPSEDEPGNESSGSDAPPEGYELVCPPGGGSQSREGVCARVFSSPTAQYAEPFVAVHPADPDVFAVGMNTRTPGTVPVDPDARGGDFTGVVVAATQDGGETFTWSILPAAEAASGADGDPHLVQAVDPALVYEADGTLHATWLVFTEEQDGTQGRYADHSVFATTSDDGGRTWATPTRIAPTTDSDRNWIALGPDGNLYVSWLRQAPSNHGRLAYREPAGNWTYLDGGLPTCSFPSQPVAVAGGAFVACGNKDNTTIVRVNATGPSAEVVATVPAGDIFPVLDRGPTGRLALLVDHVDENASRRTVEAWVGSPDGRNWTRLFEAFEDLEASQAWAYAENRWLSFDPSGLVHVLVEGRIDRPVLSDISEDRNPVAYAVLDPLDGRLVQQQVVTPALEDPVAQAGSGTSQPGGLVPDDYHGLDFGTERGVAAWSYDQKVFVSLLEPRDGNETAEE